MRQLQINTSMLSQTWCRGKKHWESETLCLDCHNFSWRAYRDPDFKTPEDYARDKWESMMTGTESAAVGA